MKIAYYEENNYHTEIIGTFLEPYINDEIIIFNDKDNSGYIDFFKNYINFEIKNINLFIDEYLQFDKIFIGSSTSFKYLNVIDIQKYKEKFFFITHLKDDLDKYKNYNGYILTPLNIINNLDFILPINNFYTTLLDKNYSKISICLIGRFKDKNRNINDLVNLLENYNHLNFEIIIYTRHKKFIPNIILNLQNKYGNNKLKIFYKLLINDIIKSLNKITFFCPLSSNKSCYITDRLTGMIPFSYNFNTPLLLDQETNKIYKLKSPIIYNNSLCEIIEKICLMDKNTYNKLLENIILEKKKIIKNNNKLIKKKIKL